MNIGDTRNLLTLLSVSVSESRHASGLFRCQCGVLKTIRLQKVRAGTTKSCGCKRNSRPSVSSGDARVKHGFAPDGEANRSGAYKSWRTMRRRCHDPKRADYYLYGGRGITICKRWDEFANFYDDMGARPANRTLDRIDSNWNYTPSNCRWATSAEQLRNRRSPKKRAAAFSGASAI